MSRQSTENIFPACDVPQVSEADVVAICETYGNDPHRMLDILREMQDQYRCISPQIMTIVARQTGLTRVAVEGVASFYSFLTLTPRGRITIRLCDDIIDRFAGLADVVHAFEDELGIKVGHTSGDGAFSLEYTPCIGMCDQAPAAMINDIVSRPAASGAAAARAIPTGPSGGTRRRRRRSGASSSAMPTRGSRGPSRTGFC
jgi:[NiFe] hydrogenase diaphorase moiety large subunit